MNHTYKCKHCINVDKPEKCVSCFNLSRYMLKPSLLPVISVYQPWASLIALGYKLVETRLHDKFKNLLNKTICIHAANHYDRDTSTILGFIKPLLLDIEYTKIKHLTLYNKLPYGAIVCTAYVYDYRKLNSADSRDALCDCSQCNRYGLFLSQIKMKTIPNISGQRGMWYYNMKG